MLQIKNIAVMAHWSGTTKREQSEPQISWVHNNSDHYSTIFCLNWNIYFRIISNLSFSRPYGQNHFRLWGSILNAVTLTNNDAIAIAFGCFQWDIFHNVSFELDSFMPQSTGQFLCNVTAKQSYQVSQFKTFVNGERILILIIALLSYKLKNGV